MDETESSFKRIVRGSKTFLQVHHLKILIGFLCLFLLSLVVYDRYQLQTKKNPPLPSSPFLFVQQVSPFNGETTYPNRIEIAFSEAVDTEVFGQYFSISPEIKGEITHGINKKIIYFTPDEPFQEGYIIAFNIREGLPSISGKSLLSNYTSSFTASVKSETVTFTKDYTAGRVLSFAKNKPISLEVAKTLSKDVDLLIYRSTQANLLNYLVYTQKKDEKGTDIPYSSEFIRYFVEHQESSLVEKRVQKTNTEKQTFNLPPGVYYLEASYQKKPLGSTFIIVNSIGVIARQDDQKVTLTTYDLDTNNQAAYSASMGFYNMKDSPNQLAVHTYNGFERSYSFDLDRNLDLIIGTINNETVFIPFKLPQSMADIRATNLDKTYKLFIHTDRPIYKPKDTVKFSGIVRMDSDSQYKMAPAGTRIKVSLNYDQDANMIVTTNDRGVFSGEFVLADDAKEFYSLTASSNIENPYDGAFTYTYFEVAKYNKPDFELTSSVAKSEYLRNEKMKFTVSGKYFNGEVLKDQEIVYSIYAQDYYEVEKAVYNKNFNVTQFGGMCGGGFDFGDEYYGEAIGGERKGSLNNEGKLDVEFDLPDTITSSKQITLVAKKKDKSGNEIISAAKTVVHGAEYNVFFMPSATNYKANEQFIAPFYVENLQGDKITNQEFTYTLRGLEYTENISKENSLVSGKVTTDDQGRGIVSLKVPESKEEYGKYLMIETRDNNGNKVEARKYIRIINQQEESYSWNEDGIDQTYLKITSRKNNYIVGDKIVLNVKSPKELDATVTLERGRIYQPQVIRLFPGDNTITLDVNAELSPSITAVFSFFADGKYHTEGVALNVPAMHKLMTVTLSSDKNRYKPQENANLLVKTQDPNGNPVSATLTMSLVDKAIFSLRKSSSPPIHSAMYYFRSRSTNASSSLTPVGIYGIGGRGGGGGGGDNISKVVDTLYWNPNVRTDTNGEARVTIPLQGFETTWKASVIGSSDDTLVGQGELDILVTTKEVQGAKIKKQHTTH